MRNQGVLIGLLAGLGLALAMLSSRSVNAGDDAERIAKLIQDLGSPKFALREKAQRELETLGVAALPALRKASESQDLETAQRATDLVKRLEERQTFESLLQPKMVRLSLQETPVLEAVRELVRQSGYNIEIQGDRTKLADRKVTLETGKVSFWQAFDHLCAKAGLTQIVNTPAAGMGLSGVEIQWLNPNGGNVVVPVLPGNQIAPVPAVAPVPPPPPAVPPNQVPPARKVNEAIQVQFEAKGAAAAAQVEVPPVAPAQKAAPAQQVPPAKQEKPAPKDGGQKGGVGAAGGGIVIINGGNAQPVQIQIQAAPGQVQPVQVQPGTTIYYARPQVSSGSIIVGDGKHQQYPTYYAGAVRIRILPMPAAPGGQNGVPQPDRPFANQPGRPNALPAQPPLPPDPKTARDEVALLLEVTPEPRMAQHFSITSQAQVTSAIDEHGQKLTVPLDAMPEQEAHERAVFNNFGMLLNSVYPQPYGPGPGHVPVALKPGEKPAKSLQELVGHLSVQMLTPSQTLLEVEHVMNSAGKKIEGKHGGTLEMLTVAKQSNGQYHVKFRMQLPQNTIFDDPIRVGGAPANVIQPLPIAQGRVLGGRATLRPANAQGLPVLLDSAGKPFQVVQNQRLFHDSGHGMPIQEVTLVFAPQNEQGEPARLVLTGRRPIQVPVSFSFKDVPLPQAR